MQSPENKKPSKHLEEYLLKEFQQGNFSNLRDTRLSSEEIVEILLQHPETSEEYKSKLLKHILAKCNTFTYKKENDTEIIQRIREHNDKVRNNLRRMFETESQERLKELGLETFNKYNNRFRVQRGGLSIQEALNGGSLTVEMEETIREERIEYISNCIKKIQMSNLSKAEEMMQRLREICNKKEFEEARQNQNQHKESKNTKTWQERKIEYLEEMKGGDFSALNGVCLNKKDIIDILSILDNENNTTLYNKIIEICDKNRINLKKEEISKNQMNFRF